MIVIYYQHLLVLTKDTYYCAFEEKQLKRDIISYFSDESDFPFYINLGWSYSVAIASTWKGYYILRYLENVIRVNIKESYLRYQVFFCDERSVNALQIIVRSMLWPDSEFRIHCFKFTSINIFKCICSKNTCRLNFESRPNVKKTR